VAAGHSERIDPIFIDRGAISVHAIDAKTRQFPGAAVKLQPQATRQTIIVN
jgi:hypothetical protein